jgi:hypothetical protein
MKFLTGQRVIVEDEIGTVRRGSTDVVTSNQALDEWRPGYIWVYLPSKGYVSQYDERNVKELPGGQL